MAKQMVEERTMPLSRTELEKMKPTGVRQLPLGGQIYLLDNPVASRSNASTSNKDCWGIGGRRRDSISSMPI
jgi:hypothetical protein